MPRKRNQIKPQTVAGAMNLFRTDAGKEKACKPVTFFAVNPEEVQALPSLVGHPERLSGATIRTHYERTDFPEMNGYDPLELGREAEVFGAGMAAVLGALPATDDQTAERSTLQSASLWAHARATGIRLTELRQSFEHAAEIIPALWDHCEAVEVKNPTGFRMKDYRLDAVGFMAFMYWRCRHGHLPAELEGVR